MRPTSTKFDSRTITSVEKCEVPCVVEGIDISHAAQKDQNGIGIRDFNNPRRLIQDQDFLDLDKRFLKEHMQYEVVKDPAAFVEIAEAQQEQDV
ncbi:MAG: hypothetical protein Q9165_006529 [Trypethelium subeluteriae]